MAKSGALALLGAFGVTILLAACAAPPISSTKPQPSSKPVAKPDVTVPAAESRLRIVKTSFSKLPGWRGDTHQQAIPTLLKSCGRLAKQPEDGWLGEKKTGKLGGRIKNWRKICAAASEVPTGDAALSRVFFEKHFVPYLATNSGKPEGLFTGYFEMELRGSWVKNGTYNVPLYERPADIVEADLGTFRPELNGKRLTGKIVEGRFVPYETRADIDFGALEGRGLEILWVNSRTDAFFLHVQGSGRVVMDDGSIVRVGFAGRNGHVYNSIGRELIKMGAMTRERVSMQSIRAWIKDNPEKAEALMHKNPSYIFFRVVDGALKSLKPGDGPVGAQGVALTPGRSLAIDRQFMPLGIPVWLDTTDPLDSTQPLRRLVVTQDTGSAIKGPVRGDVFWGFGDAAALKAGLMKQRGRYFLLLPKNRF